jgi:hypothetical protein
MLDGGEGDANSARALFLVAGGKSPGSSTAAEVYGLIHPTNTKRALERLRTRGIVEGEGTKWRIVDPLFAAWLRHQDPIALLPAGKPE